MGKLATALLCIVALSGCQLGSYGKSSPYPYDVAEKIAVTVPPNAPSVIQQFRPLSPEKGQDSGAEHPGIDIYEARGFPVLAAADGVVTQSSFGGSYGHKIVLRHKTGPDGYAMQTVYKHLSARDVQPGATVKRGQKIAGLGNSGLLAAGIVHLHFEVRQIHETRTVPQDPHLYWADGVGRVTCFDPARQYAGFALTYPVPCR